MITCADHREQVSGSRSRGAGWTTRTGLRGCHAPADAPKSQVNRYRPKKTIFFPQNGAPAHLFHLRDIEAAHGAPVVVARARWLDGIRALCDRRFHALLGIQAGGSLWVCELRGLRTTSIASRAKAVRSTPAFPRRAWCRPLAAPAHALAEAHLPLRLVPLRSRHDLPG